MRGNVANTLNKGPSLRSVLFVVFYLFVFVFLRQETGLQSAKKGEKVTFKVCALWVDSAQRRPMFPG